MLSLAAKIRACIIFSPPGPRPRRLSSPRLLPPRRSRPRSRSNVDLCPRVATQYSAPARTTTTSGFRLEFIDPRASAPRPLRGKGIKIPLLRRSLLPAVDNGDSGARVIEGLDISTSHSIAAVGLVPNFVQIIFRACFLSIIS